MKPNSALKQALHDAARDGDLAALLEAATRVEYRKLHAGQDCPEDEIPPAQTLAEFVSSAKLDGGDGGVAMAPEHVASLYRRWFGQPEPRPPHPLGLPIRTWLRRPRMVDADKRSNAIVPAPFACVRDLRSECGALFGDMPLPARTGLHAPTQSELFASLPGFGPAPPVAVPALPLVLFDAPRMSKSRHRGAPLSLRLWVEAVLSVPRSHRQQTARLTITLRDLIAALWPTGWTGPGRSGPQLIRALHTVHAARVPWTNAKGEPAGYWAAVVVRNMPDVHRLDSVVVLDVELPPGSEAGPMVYRPMLRRYGVLSAPAYRLCLSLAYLWNRHLTSSGKRLPPTVPVVKRNAAGVLVDKKGQPLTANGGVPVMHWNDRRAIQTGETMRNPELDRLPWLSPADLIAMGAPEADLHNPATARSVLRHVREAARMMHAAGDVVCREDADRERRVRLEPPGWWGAPDGERACNRAR